MQKTKRIILLILSQGSFDRFELRKLYAKKTNPTNSSELMRQLNSLQKSRCIIENGGRYSMTEKGEEVLSLLGRINQLLSE